MTCCGCEYYKGLSSDDAQYYDKKLRENNISCPYCMKEGWTRSMKDWPQTNYFHIFEYLITSKSSISGDEMEAYKSLGSINYVACGIVNDILYNNLSEDHPFCLLKASVGSGQRIHMKIPHAPWVCINKADGKVSSAHCTCMAGLGTCCCHVGALLYGVDTCNKTGLNAVTSSDCQWNKHFASRHVEPIIAEELDYSVPKHEEQATGKQNRKSVKRPVPVDCSDLPADIIKKKLCELNKIYSDASFFTPPSYSTTDTGDEIIEDINFPPLMLSHFPLLDDYDVDERKKRSKILLSNLSATTTQCENLEKSTREQSNNKLWYEYRQGRITASMCHRIYRLRETTDRDSILKSIIWNTGSDKNLKEKAAIKWGIENESKALNLYECYMKENHTNGKVNKVGFLVCSEYPYIGATPDGIFSCDCCTTKILIECKCPYKYKDSNIHTTCADFNIEDSTFCLNNEGQLKTTHSYYTQIQLQMFVFKIEVCDFVVWTLKGATIVRVLFNSQFCKGLIEKLKLFAQEYLALELITRRLQ